MRVRTRYAGVVLALAVGAVHGAAVRPGDLVILQSIGDSAVAAETAVGVALVEFSTVQNSPAIQTINIPVDGAQRLTIGASTGTEGLLTYNDGYIGIAGYDAAVGTAAVFRTAANAPRRILAFDASQDLAGTPHFNAIVTQFNNGNFRSALYLKAVDGAYGVGAPNGVIFQTNGATTGGTNIVTGGPGGAYGIGIFNGNTYFTTQSGTRGIYRVAGTPTTTGNAASIYTPTPAAGNGGTAVSAYNFWISPDGGTVYEAEDFDAGTGGIKKYVKQLDGTFALAYTINTDYDGADPATTGVRSISVDDSGASPLIYATTYDRRKVIALTDTGTAAGAAATLSVLQTAAENSFIRSVVFVPHVPGDANDNGVVNADDYALIDRGYSRYAGGAIGAGLAVWADGDFNRDGAVNSADYLIIDTRYAATHPLSPELLDLRGSQFGTDYVSSLLAAVPEPAALSLVVGGIALLGRRRKAAGLAV